MNQAALKSTVARAVAKAIMSTIDVSEIVSLCEKRASKTTRKKTTRKKTRPQRPLGQSSGKAEPEPGSNVGRMLAYLRAHPNQPIESRPLERLLVNRREKGERSSGDAASVCSNVNYLRTKYGCDVERLEVGVYRLNVPSRRR